MNTRLASTCYAQTPRQSNPSRAALALAALLVSINVGYAADAAWNVDAAGSWATAGSWNPAAAPGSTSTSNSTDIATFNKTLTAGRAVTVDANRNIGGITFDHSDAFAYTFSTTGSLRLTNGGVIQTAATNGNHQDVLATRIDIQGDGGSATVTSNATSSSSLLSLGSSAAGTFGTTPAVQGVSTGGNTTTLTLNGSSVGTGVTNGTTNSIIGRIQNGAGGGNLAVVKSGTGTWRLSGSNTYTGGTTISGGTLNISRLDALGTGAIVNNATLDVLVGNGAITGLITGLSGSGTVNLPGSSMGTGATSTTLMAGNGTYSGFTGTWNIGTGAAAGAGRAALNGNSSASSSVNVAANATVIVTSAVTHNAVLTLAGGDTGESLGQLRLEGGANWAGNVTLSGDISGTGDGTVGSNTNQSGTISGIIKESGGSRALSKVGGGNITLTNANTYTGETRVNGGALNIQNASALGTTAAGTTVASGARLELQGGITVTSENLTISGSGGNFFGALQSKSGTNVWNGNVTIAADATRIGAASNSTLEVAGKIDSGSNVFNVTYRPQDATATVIVSGANTYIGSTSIIGGVVSVSSLNSVSGGSASSSLGAPTTVAAGTIAVGAGSAGTLRYTGSGETTDRVIDLAGTTFGTTLDQSGLGVLKFTSDLTATGAGNKTLTLLGSTAGSGEISGAVVDNSPTNRTSVTKSGTGTWVLSGTNTYTGNTTVTAGTLQVDGALGATAVNVTGGTLKVGASGSVGSANITINGGSFDATALVGGYTVGSGQTISGSGTFNGDITIGVGANLSPGNSPGVTTFSDDLTLAGTTTLEVNGTIRSTEHDGINLTGLANSLVYGGALSMSFNAVPTANVYDLFQIAGTVAQSGTFGSVSIGGTAVASSTAASITGLGWSATLTDNVTSAVWNLVFNNATGDLTITAIPEPATFAALAGLGVLGLAASRRRKTSARN